MWKKVAKINGKTDDIISALCMAVPSSIEQVKKFNLPETIGLNGVNLIDDAIKTGRWIRANVTYRIDDFGFQNIQYPSAVLRDGFADCKSISLLYLSIMEAAGWNGGFRFASYKKDKPFTHVYNFFLDNRNNIYTFDGCLKDLKEIKKYKHIKDMQVNYIAGVPQMIDKNPQGLTYKRRSRYYMGETEGIGRKKGKGKLKKFIKKGFKALKGVALAPARAPFIALTTINFRGLARKFAEARTKNPDKYQEFWLKVGGNIDKLNKAVDKGKDKKPFLGEKKGVSGIYGIDDSVTIGYIGAEPVSTATLLTAAAGLVAAAGKLFKSLGIKNKEGEKNVEEGVEDAPVSEELGEGENFAANDPASKEAEEYANSGGVVKPNIKSSTKGDGGGIGFKPSPLIIGGGIAALGLIYFLTKSKKGK